ncbi:MAG: oligosaccharide flippase family protein [Thermoplasmata archaeon]|nr:oligosaccharide flippase family protein [Thermoplasmata archaeon]
MAFIQQFFNDLKTPLYKNAIYLTMNVIIASGLGFLFWMVVARYYPPYQVGLAATIIPVMGLIGMLSGFGFGDGLVRFLPSSGKNSGSMINSCFTLASLAAILFSFVFLIGMDIWSPTLLFVRENWMFFLSFVLFSIVFALHPMMNQIFVARRNVKFVLASTSIGGLKILLLVVFASFFGAFGIFASWSAAMLIAVVVGILIFIPIVNPGYTPFLTVNRRVVNRILHFSAGNYVAGVFGVLPMALPPLLVLHLLGAEDVAYYRIAFTIAGLLFAVAYGIAPSLFAEGSHCEEELGKNVRKALRFVFAMLIPGIIVTIFFGKHILLLFGSEYSSEGLILLEIFALSSILVALNRIFITTRRVLKRLKPIVAVAAFNAFAIIGMGYVLLLSVGLVGIAIAWTLSQGIVTAGIGVYLLRERLRKADQAPFANP